MRAIMADGVAQGRMPGGVVLVWHDGATVLHEAYGHAVLWQDADTQLDEPVPATTATIYDCASVSKLFTATGVMRLVERGAIGLDSPVAHAVPEFAANGKEAVTVRQLLAHVGGLRWGMTLWLAAPTAAERLRCALAQPLDHPPATVFRYNSAGTLALGVLAERVDSRPLDRQVAEDITGPLGMPDTGYNPAPGLRHRIAATEYRPHGTDRGMVRGTVHDENTWALGGVAGHAGLFSTASDLLRFARCHLEGGSLDGYRLLTPETAAEMRRCQTAYLAPDAWRGLGWELNQPYYMGKLSAPATFGHTGFTGTSVVVEPRSRTILILLSNRVHPTRDGPPFNPVREAVADAAADALGIAAG